MEYPEVTEKQLSSLNEKEALKSIIGKPIKWRQGAYTFDAFCVVDLERGFVSIKPLDSEDVAKKAKEGDFHWSYPPVHPRLCLWKIKDESLKRKRELFLLSSKRKVFSTDMFILLFEGTPGGCPLI